MNRFHASVTDEAKVERAAAGCEVVFHLAALASVAKSVEDPQATHAAVRDRHAERVERRAQSRCALGGVRRERGCYGNASDPAGQGEDTPLMALSPYAAAKLAGELYAESFAHTYGMETVRLRFFNVFGPRQRRTAHTAASSRSSPPYFSSGRTPTVHGDGLQSRDFVYVADVAKALMLAATTAGVSGRVYNAARHGRGA